MDRVHPTAPSVSESVDLEQRQHVNIVYYENQNAMHQRLLVVSFLIKFKKTTFTLINNFIYKKKY